MAATLHLALLGDLRVTLNESPVTGFVSGKVQALLCYLAVTRRPHQRSALAALFWGDQPEEAAATNLRQALANLRRLLEPYLLINRQTVAFNTAAPYLLDVDAFQGELQRLDALEASSRTRAGLSPEVLSHLQRAVDLYTGDFLQGFRVRDAPAFDEWALAQQERLRELALRALDRLAMAHMARGEYTAAMAATARLLAVDPWREEAHRQLMLLLARTGQRQAALLQYERCRRVLEHELGVEPMPETLALYEQIRASLAEPRRPIVLPGTSFVGREAERSMLQQLLADPQYRLITIVGPGGAGKSRLALQVAADYQQRYLHGAIGVLLANVTSGALLVSGIAGALGLTFERQSPPAEQLIDYLREKELLLVLDNFEHLVEVGSDLIAAIIARAPSVQVLVTSRERLRLQEEWLLELEGLVVPAAVGAEGVEQGSAVRLFAERARRIQPSFEVRDADAEHVLAICRLVDGLPLAIELAAGATRSFTPAEIAREIGHNRDFLHTNLRNVPERQRSMRATFEYSWKLLSSAEQTTYRQLSVFRGGFDRAGAAGVASATAALLTALADKSLLRRDEAGRYDLHDLLRDYAHEKLMLVPDEYVATRGRHLRHVGAALQRQTALLRGPDQRVALDAIGAEIENVRHAWQWAIEQADLDTIDAALEGCFQFYELRGLFQEGAGAFDVAAVSLTAHRAGEDREQGVVDRLLARQAVLVHRLGQYEQARGLLLRSLASARGRDDHPEIGFCLNHLGYVAYNLGAYPEARRLFEESLASYRAIDDRWGMAAALTNLGLIGTSAERAALLQQSLELCRAISDQHTTARVLNNLGGVRADQGHYAEARAMFEQSITIFEQIGYRRGAAYALYQLSSVYSYAGDFAAAWGCAQRGLALFETIGDRRGIALCHISLGMLASDRGEYEQARHLLHAALALCDELGDRYLRVYTLDQLGAVERAEGKLAQSEAYHRAALAIARDLGNEPTAVVLVSLAGVVAQAGDRLQACEHWLEALALAVEQQFGSVMADAVLGLATHLDEKDSAQAIELLQAVVDHPASYFTTRDEARRRLDSLLARLPQDSTMPTPWRACSSTLESIAARLLAQRSAIP